ncbi:hypothetical protein WJX81_006889 [Elliptochloris bilobata]|uniref:Sulfotransferase domain-containing protein n=1 Tax=Elliptochloris bilobata TaxID=381761 RepID=A0AAW1SHN5_9CHLO
MAAPTTAHKVLSWGVDGNPRPLGRATGDPRRPGLVGGLPDMLVSVAAAGHSLAVDGAGALWSWGRNDSAGGGGGGSAPLAASGQLGAPRVGPAAVPAKMAGTGAGGLRFVAVAAGRYHSIGLTSDGAVHTWGLNDHFQLGRQAHNESGAQCDGGAGCACADVAAGRVAGLPSVKAIAAGRYNSLAVDERGRVWTWGLDSCGLAEDGRRIGQPPRLVGGGLGGEVVALAAGYRHWLALTACGRGPLGLCIQVALTARLPGFGRGEPWGPAVALAGGEHTLVVATLGGQVVAWGIGAPEPALLEGAPEGMRAVTVSGAHQHFLAIYEGGAARSEPGSSASSTMQGGADELVSLKKVPAEVRAAAPDVFAGLAPLQPGLRSPCFHNTSGHLRCLPYFSIIGVSKCGTTDLHHKLLALPSVVRTANKGPHFWDEVHSLQSYLENFDGVAAAAAADPCAIASDASSNTFSYAIIGLRGVANTSVPLPVVHRAAQPRTRLILLLREPAERMHSAFWYYGCMHGLYQRHGLSAAGFHAFAQEEVAIMRSCLQESSLVACATREWGAAQQLIKGVYVLPMVAWLAAYPREQLLILTLEELRQDAEGVLAHAAAFLDLAPTKAQLAAAARVRANRGHNMRSGVPRCGGARDPMWEQTAALLRGFYAPFNAQLADLLGDLRYTWRAA